MQLQGLRAANAVVTVSALSSVSGLEAQTMTVVVSSSSSVSVTATTAAAYTCSSSSEVTIVGNAKVTEWWRGNCRVSVNPAPAPAGIILP